MCAALCVEPPAHLSKSAVPLKGTAPERQGFACSCRFKNGGWFWELQRNLLSSVNDIRDDDASHSTNLWDLCAQPLSPNILTECSWFTFSKLLGMSNLFYSSLGLGLWSFVLVRSPWPRSPQATTSQTQGKPQERQQQRKSKSKNGKNDTEKITKGRRH